jgi:hypothetical protein
MTFGMGSNPLTTRLDWRPTLLFTPAPTTFFSLATYSTQVQQLVHDTAAIDFSQTDLTGFINNARNRVALDFHNVRYLFSNACLPANTEQLPIQGGVCGLTIVNGGSGYVSPVITIGAPGTVGGATALATPIVSNGAIIQANMISWGAGYATNPTVNVTDVGGGTGASLIPMTAIGIYDINSISVLWGLQRYTLGWLPFTQFQAFCRANLTLRRQPAVWTTFTEQNILFVYPIPDQPYLCDLDLLGFTAPLVMPTDLDSQILQPINDCVQYYAAYLALLKMQNFEQADYYQKKYNERAGEIIRTKQDRRIPNVYRNAWRRINRW